MMCAKGLHPWSLETTVPNGNGRRSCRECRAISQRANQKPCRVEGCPRYRHWGDLCHMHARRLRKHGNVDWTPMTNAEVIVEVEWLLGSGLGWGAVAQAVGKKPLTLANLLFREGRSDLAVVFEASRYAA